LTAIEAAAFASSLGAVPFRADDPGYTACGMRCMRQAAIFFTESGRITNFSHRVDSAALATRSPRVHAREILTAT
jgi:hypothetical protein